MLLTKKATKTSMLKVLTTLNNSAYTRQIHKRVIYFLIRHMYQEIKLNCLIYSLCDWQMLNCIKHKSSFV